MNIMHSKITSIICLFFFVFIKTSLHGMEDSRKNYFTSKAYSNFSDDCDDLELTFREAIFEQLPLDKNVIHGIEEEQPSAFKKEFLKDNGFKAVFHDNYEQTLDYLHRVWETSEIPQKVDNIASTIERHNALNLSSEEIQSLLREYFIELYLQKFYSPKLDCLLKSCICAKAPLTSKLLCMLSAVNNLSLTFPPEQCTESRPLVSTFYGPGRLMAEYLILRILAHRGYGFVSSHYIDPIYKDEAYTDIFNAQSEQLIRNNCVPQISIFDSANIFKKFMEINQLKHHLLISIDPGDIRKIKDKKASKRAHLAHVTLRNPAFNQHHCIKMNIRNLKSIKAEHSNQVVHNGSYTTYTSIMNRQISKLNEKLNHHFISKQHESQETFVIGLHDFIEKEKVKIQKKSSHDHFNLIDVEWFRDPSIDFENFAKQYITPSTTCLMVHQELHKFTLASAKK